MKNKYMKFLKDLKKVTLLVKVGDNYSMVFFESKREKKKTLKALVKGKCVTFKNYDDIDSSIFDLDKKDGFTTCDLTGGIALWN